MEDIKLFFGTLILRVRKFSEGWDLDGYQIISRDNFDYKCTNLNIRITEKIVNENDSGYEVKNLPIEKYFNERNLELKEPNYSKPLSKDKSLRGIYSRNYQIRQFIPFKSDKFGKK